MKKKKITKINVARHFRKIATAKIKQAEVGTKRRVGRDGALLHSRRIVGK